MCAKKHAWKEKLKHLLWKKRQQFPATRKKVSFLFCLLHNKIISRCLPFLQWLSFLYGFADGGIWHVCSLLRHRLSRSHTRLVISPSLPPHPFLSQIVGYDHGSKPLSMLSTCNLCTFTGTIYKEMYICWKERIQNTFFFLKKDYSFQQLEKRFISRFLCDHNSQRQICPSMPFSSSYQPLRNKPFKWLSIGRNHCCFLFTQTLKVGNIICYGYLFHIVFH